MSKYSLTGKNDTPKAGSSCVYTTSPDTQKIQQDLRSLAWFTKAVNPNGQVRFAGEQEAKEDEKGRPGSKQGGPFVCAGEGKDEDTDLQDPAEHKALNGD